MCTYHRYLLTGSTVFEITLVEKPKMQSTIVIDQNNECFKNVMTKMIAEDLLVNWIELLDACKNESQQHVRSSSFL